MPNIEVQLLQTYDDRPPPLTVPPSEIPYTLRLGAYPLKEIVDKKTTDVNNPSPDNRNKEIDTIETTKKIYYLVPESEAESETININIPSHLTFDIKLQLIQLFETQQGEFISKIDDLLILNEELDLPRIPKKNTGHEFDQVDKNKILHPKDIFSCGIIVNKVREFDFVRWGIVPNAVASAAGLPMPGEYVYTTFEISYTHEMEYEITGETRVYENDKEINTSPESGRFKRFGRIINTIKLPFFLIVPSPDPKISPPINPTTNKPYPINSPQFKKFYKDVYNYLKTLEFGDNTNHHIRRASYSNKIDADAFHTNEWLKFDNQIKSDIKGIQQLIDRFNNLGTGTEETHSDFGLKEACNGNCWRYFKHTITSFTYTNRQYISSIALIQDRALTKAGSSKADDFKDLGRTCRMYFSLPPMNTTQMKDKDGKDLRLLNDLRPLEPISIPNAPKELENKLANWNDDGCGLVPGGPTQDNLLAPSLPRVYTNKDDDTTNPYSKYSMSELTKYLISSGKTLDSVLSNVNLTVVFNADARLYQSRDDEKTINRYDEFTDVAGLERTQDILDKIAKYNKYGVWYRLTNNKFENITPELVEIKDGK